MLAARDKWGTFSPRITVLWDTRRTECWLWCGCQGREISNYIIVALALCREQENTFTAGRAWLVRSSSLLRRVMFAEPTIRDSLKRPWSDTKSQIYLGPKLELTCSVTGVVTTSSVGINTPPFGRLTFLSTHGQQQWFGSWRPNSHGIPETCVSDDGSQFVSYEFKDVRAHCYCASLVPALFIRHARATSFSSARTELKTQQNIELMTFVLDWCANIFVGCSVTLTFFFGRSIPFLILSVILKNKKICVWEVLIISHILFK